ncbi:MAG: hypothetical protein R2701_05995 [Acidimicrobiales bacterium]
MDLVLPIALAVAVISAVRGVWSPCGLSMLSSITPMTEAGRGHRFASTATWFTVGGVVGGLSLGAVAAGGAAAIGALGLADTTRWAIAAAAAAGHRGHRPRRHGHLAADLQAPGERRLAARLPVLGVRRRVRLADRRGRRHVHHDGWRAAHRRSGGPHRFARRRPGHRLHLRPGAGERRLDRSRSDHPRRLGRVHDRLEALAPASRAAAAVVQVAAAAILATAGVGPIVGLVVLAAAAAAVGVRRGSARPATA